jgi:hypothetical protein
MEILNAPSLGLQCDRPAVVFQSEEEPMANALPADNARGDD